MLDARYARAARALAYGSRARFFVGGWRDVRPRAAGRALLRAALPRGSGERSPLRGVLAFGWRGALARSSGPHSGAARRSRGWVAPSGGFAPTPRAPLPACGFAASLPRRFAPRPPAPLARGPSGALRPRPLAAFGCGRGVAPCPP